MHPAKNLEQLSDQGWTFADLISQMIGDRRSTYCIEVSESRPENVQYAHEDRLR
jgi:hypothetical protein